MAKEKHDKFIYSTQDAAEFFGVHRDTMTDLAKRGAPKAGRGKWNLKDVMEWRYKTDALAGKESPEVRKLKAEADLKEIKKQQEAIRLAVQEGKYVSVEQISHDFTLALVSLKNSLLAIGHRVAAELDSMDLETATAAKGIVDSCIREALEQLSKSGIYGKKRK